MRFYILVRNKDKGTWQTKLNLKHKPPRPAVFTSEDAAKKAILYAAGENALAKLGLEYKLVKEVEL